MRDIQFARMKKEITRYRSEVYR